MINDKENDLKTFQNTGKNFVEILDFLKNSSLVYNVKVFDELITYKMQNISLCKELIPATNSILFNYSIKNYSKEELQKNISIHIEEIESGNYYQSLFFEGIRLFLGNKEDITDLYQKMIDDYITQKDLVITEMDQFETFSLNCYQLDENYQYKILLVATSGLLTNHLNVNSNIQQLSKEYLHMFSNDLEDVIIKNKLTETDIYLLNILLKLQINK